MDGRKEGKMDEAGIERSSIDQREKLGNLVDSNRNHTMDGII